MRFKITSILVLFSLFFSQTLSAVAQAVDPATQLAGQAITVPTGAVIPLTLITVIKSKSTKPGDLVRAQVAFPVIVGSQVAIPAGTYVEGSVEAVAAKKTKSSPGGLQIHFTRLIYANGYAVSLDALSSHAQMVAPLMGLPRADDTNAVALGKAFERGEGPRLMSVSFAGAPYGMAGQAAPPPPPLAPLPGPPKAFLISAAIGGAIVIGTILFVAFGHHHRSDTLLYDSGWQFSMTLSAPVSVDLAQASPAPQSGKMKGAKGASPRLGSSAPDSTI